MKVASASDDGVFTFLSSDAGREVFFFGHEALVVDQEDLNVQVANESRDLADFIVKYFPGDLIAGRSASYVALRLLQRLTGKS